MIFSADMIPKTLKINQLLIYINAQTEFDTKIGEAFFYYKCSEQS